MHSKSLSFLFLLILSVASIAQINNNDVNCNLGLTIPDDGCGSNELLLDIIVSGEAGTQLGTDIVLEQVDISIGIGRNADMNIYLISPNGVEVNLSTDNGGSGNGYGLPGGCPNDVASFRMNTDNEIEDAPVGNFTGIYRPEGDFEDFNDGTDPNGTWQLRICDDRAGREGTLRHVNLTFATPPGNDQCGNATPIACGQTLTGTNLNATFDPGAGNCFFTSNTVGGGVWYSWTGDGSCVTLSTCNAGTDLGFDSKITVYEGSCGGLNCVTGDDDAGVDCFLSDLFTTVSFTSTPGANYFILVHGFSFSAGQFELSMECGGAPANDNVCSAQAVPLNAPFNANGGCATAEPGELDPGSDPTCISQDGWCFLEPPSVQNSLWFTFEAPPSGRVRIITDDFDNAQFALWEVGDCSNWGSFTEIAANDNRAPEDFDPRIINVCLIPGDTYYLQIDGYRGFPYNTNITINQVGVDLGITCPGNVTVQCGQSTDPSATGVATANTNMCCMNPPVISPADLTTTFCTDEYSISRTWTATYDCGASFSCSQIISVVDNTPPDITCPAAVTIECNESTDPANTGTATASDNCDTDVTVSPSDALAPGACMDAQVITRTWTATDNCGNNTPCDQVITVVDTTDPVLVCPGNKMVECDESTDPINTGEATATDNCDTDVSITSEDLTTAGNCPQNYTITRTWTAADNCGNIVDCNQIIEVRDTKAPNIVCNSPFFTVNLNPDGAYTPTQAEIEALGAGTTDNCGIVTFSFESFSCEDEGQKTVDLVAIDECGNPSSCPILVTINPFFTIDKCVATDESCEGFSDGTICVEGSTLGGQLMYSVDGVNWQTEGDFKFLTPGTYTVYVRVFGIDYDCVKTETKIIAPGPAKTTWYKDLDDDGHSDGVTDLSCAQPMGYKAAGDLISLTDDCNDNNSNIYPGAPEICDGFDNDCDGVMLADEVDVDGDGFLACDNDCNDFDASINPDSPEICNGIDDNCDGNIDEGVTTGTYVGNVVFSNQQQLDDWAACYNVIQGNVTITGGNINDLSPLSNIVEITGTLIIGSNSMLTSLDGLENLNLVGGSLFMYYNFTLSDCCAIDNLLENGGVTGMVLIFFNSFGSHCNSEAEIITACPLTPLISNPNSLSTAEAAVSINDARKMSLFPNPAASEVNVVLERKAPTATLRVINMLGSIVMEQELGKDIDRITIDLNDKSFKNGLYMMTVTENGATFSAQLIVMQ